MPPQSDKKPTNFSPKLAIWLACLDVLFLIATSFVQWNTPEYISNFINSNGVTFHLGVTGISATLAGFVITGMAIVSTLLAKTEFKKSKLSAYYTQIFNSFKSCVGILVAVIIISLISAIFTKDNLTSIVLFYEVVYLFLASLIAIWYSVGIIGEIMNIDSGDVIRRLQDADIARTDLDTATDSED